MYEDETTHRNKAYFYRTDNVMDWMISLRRICSDFNTTLSDAYGDECETKNISPRTFPHIDRTRKLIRCETVQSICKSYRCKNTNTFGACLPCLLNSIIKQMVFEVKVLAQRKSRCELVCVVALHRLDDIDDILNQTLMVNNLQSAPLVLLKSTMIPNNIMHIVSVAVLHARNETIHFEIAYDICTIVCKVFMGMTSSSTYCYFCVFNTDKYEQSVTSQTKFICTAVLSKQLFQIQSKISLPAMFVSDSKRMDEDSQRAESNSNDFKSLCQSPLVFSLMTLQHPSDVIGEFLLKHLNEIFRMCYCRIGSNYNLFYSIYTYAQTPSENLQQEELNRKSTQCTSMCRERNIKESQRESSISTSSSKQNVFSSLRSLKIDYEQTSQGSIFKIHFSGVLERFYLESITITASIEGKCEECAIPCLTSKDTYKLREDNKLQDYRGVARLSASLPSFYPTFQSLLNAMTIPNENCNDPPLNKIGNFSVPSYKVEKLERVYHPIWEFTSKACVHDNTNGNTIDDIRHAECSASAYVNNEIPNVCEVNSFSSIEDEDEWETDDEFKFSTRLESSSFDGYTEQKSTLIDCNSDHRENKLLHRVGIYYSESDSKLRAIVYGYDQNAIYFRKMANTHRNCEYVAVKNWSPSPSFRQMGVNANIDVPCSRSVRAWKSLLLNSFYTEDEEDLYVSTALLMAYNDIKGKEEKEHSTTLNRFKSLSSGSIANSTGEYNKKSIALRIRSKLNRGVWKLSRDDILPKNIMGYRRIPKEPNNDIFKKTQPNYAIFGVPLTTLDLYDNVPRFVIDCIHQIELEDCITQEGLYRASGNKLQIEQLKRNICDSNSCDLNALKCDDVHTLTSLIKMFFRELPSPLIPQSTFVLLNEEFVPENYDRLRSIFSHMVEPNKSTLQFIIQHLDKVSLRMSENRMPASNLAIVWGPCIFAIEQMKLEVNRFNKYVQILIENYKYIFQPESHKIFRLQSIKNK